MTEAVLEVEHTPTKTIHCNLNKACDWGGDEAICCVSCPKIGECRVNCREADNWLIQGRRCPDADVP